MAVGWSGIDRRQVCVVVVASSMALALVWLAGRPPASPLAIELGHDAPVAAEDSPPARAVAEAVPEREVVAAGRPASPAGIEARTPSDPKPAPSVADIDRWIRDLHDDDVPGNASRAVDALALAGATAVPALRDALFSRDGQQRFCAAEVLRRVDPAPTPRLFEVCVEELAYEPGAAAVHYLADHASAARPQLRSGLGSRSAQQRFYCAYLLACGGDDRDLPVVCATLIDHLRDNDIAGDAVMAAHGLWRLGQPSLPHVRAALGFADPQSQRLLRLIEIDLSSPQRTDDASNPHFAAQEVTTVYLDPVVEYDIHRSALPRW